jgi:hypothetical protein
MSDDVRIALVVGGVVAIAIAIVWRTMVVQGRRRRLRAGLEASDPQDRARAAIVLVDEGLHRSAHTLLTHVAREPDSRVCHAIALAVARRQWEPVDTPRVRQLRAWASEELTRHGAGVSSFGPAVTRLSDMGGPRPPDDESRPEPAPPSAPPSCAPPSSAPAPHPTEDAAVSWHAEPNAP